MHAFLTKKTYRKHEQIERFYLRIGHVGDVRPHPALHPAADAGRHVTRLHPLLPLPLLAVVPTVISNITLLLAVKYIGGTLTSILGAMEPVTAVCIGALVFGEAFTLQEAFGIVLILVAVTLIILSKPIQHTLSSVFRMIRPRHA